MSQIRESTQVTLRGKSLSLSNLSKVLYPETGFTKGQMIAYYVRMAPILLPYLKGRALTLKRYPNGVTAPFFYEKNCPVHRPAWVKTARVMSSRSPEGVAYCTINTEPGLAWVANLGTIELHTSLALAKDVTRPTMMVFDLDPGEPATILDSARIALALHDMLARLKLQSFPKVSGSKGVHVYVPLNTAVTYEQTKSLSRDIAILMERHEKNVTSVMKRDLRAGKVFIDWSQNDEHKTTVCVYSLRAKDRPTISCPVTWKELARAESSASVSALAFDPDMAIWRAEHLGDLFQPVRTLRQRLPTAKAN